MSKNKSKTRNNKPKSKVDDAKEVVIDEEFTQDFGKEIKKQQKKEEKIEKKEAKNIEQNEPRELGKHESLKKDTNKHSFVHTILVLAMLASVAYFIITLFFANNANFVDYIGALLLTIFSILFVEVGLTTVRKKKTGFFFGALILIIYFVVGSLNALGYIKLGSNKVIDFSGVNLTDVMAWAEKHNVGIIQDYEYSDMISEYAIISQDVKPGTKIVKDLEITVAISEGPNPAKEIVIPNMVGWDAERVLEFIKKNYLTNVEVEWVEAQKDEDTVIEQSKSGNLRRDEKLKITFSYGDKTEDKEIKMKNLAGLSQFEATFYLKQHHLKYEFVEVFSNTVKKGYVIKQSIKAGKSIKSNGETVKVTISKGPEIKVPNLKKMSISDITEWVVKNKLKLEFSDQYDDSVKENAVISANYRQGDVIAEGTLIKVVLSRGRLTMPKFNSLNEFREWAEKYGINYNEEHQFSDSVPSGEVIKYSYGEGHTIKNGDSIVVTISDGKEAVVPNVVGNSKDSAATKLKNAGFNYNFVYNYSSSVAKGKVIKQSISSGSKVASGTTITLTISNGPKPSNSGGGSSGSGNTPAPSPTPAPQPVCDAVTVTIQSSLNGSSVSETSANYKRSYPNVKFNFVPKASAIGTTGMVHPDTAQKRVLTGTTCDTFTIYIIQN